MSRLNDGIRVWQGIVALILSIASPLAAMSVWRGSVDSELRHNVEAQHKQDEQIEKLTGNVLLLHDSVTRLQVLLEGLNTRLIIDAKATHDIGETQMKVVQILDTLTNTKGKP